MVCHFLRENLKNEECKMADRVTRNGRNIVERKIHWQFSWSRTLGGISSVEEVNQNRR